MFVIEENRTGEWVPYRVCKSEDDAIKGLAAMRLCDPEWQLRVATYRRQDSVTRWLVEFRTSGHGWRPWEPEGYATEADADDDAVQVRKAYPHAAVRLVSLSRTEHSDGTVV